MLPAKFTLKTLVSRGLLKNQNVSGQTFNSFVAFHLPAPLSSMKRTRASSRAMSAKKEIEDDFDNSESEIKLQDKNRELKHANVQIKNLQNEELSSTLVQNQNKIIDNDSSRVEPLLENVNNLEQKQKSKLNLKNLKNRNKRVDEELKPNTLPSKNKPRAVVDLEMMREELKQLEEPPLTDWEKQVCSNRLPFSFFNSPCEELAQNLLGKVLVRCLENGTILKGRIVETEGYLGVIDKASHSYQNKVTPRNVPMYMPPGTIYVYMTYGMYHCFNISSQESGAYVIIKAVEPLLGLDYMELLRNMQLEKNKKEKKLVDNVQCIKQYELCNSPSKICTAFVIDEDSFNEKKIYECSDLWIERNPYIKSTTVVAVHSNKEIEHNTKKVWRYYVLGSSSVTIRDIESEEHAYNI